MSATEAAEVLNDLLDTLVVKATQRQRRAGTDAIDVVLGQPARQTGVRSLQDSPAVIAFRQELVDGLIRVDTANQLLRLLNEVIVRLIP